MSTKAWTALPLSSRPGADSAAARVSFQVEQRLDFAQGHIEIRRYLWTQAIEDVIAAEGDALVLNMALSTRPARTRMARISKGGEDRPRNLGRLMMLVPGQQYRLSAPSGSLRSIHCALERRYLESLLRDQFDWNAWWLDTEPISPGAEIEGLLIRIHREMRQMRLGRAVAIEAYVNALCVELARRLQQCRPVRRSSAKGGLAPWRLKLVRDRAQAAAPAPRIAELAELCGLTERQLSRAFKTETGQTIGRYIDEVTIERASEMLASTNRPIAAIAQALGFASSTSFAHAFRRIAGVPPSDVRRR